MCTSEWFCFLSFLPVSFEVHSNVHFFSNIFRFENDTFCSVSKKRKTRDEEMLRSLASFHLTGFSLFLSPTCRRKLPIPSLFSSFFLSSIESRVCLSFSLALWGREMPYFLVRNFQLADFLLLYIATLWCAFCCLLPSIPDVAFFFLFSLCCLLHESEMRLEKRKQP